VTAADVAPGRVLHVEAVGPLATVQDLGRPGLASLGVSRSGAADRAAARRANRLVGNPEGTAVLEALLGGLVVIAGEAHLVAALTGASCPASVDVRPVALDAVLDLSPGARLRLGTATAGLRCYLAVRGGLVVPPVLGSRSRDTLAGLGPPPVRAGDVLPVGPAPAGWPTIEVVPAAGVPDLDDVVELRAVPGPRADWLDDDAVEALWSCEWTVAAASDRVGLRLAGPALVRAADRREAELPSEGLVRGAVQVTPEGPVLFLADHPVTGGYPVAAVVLDRDVDLAGQVRPGQRLRLIRATMPGPRRRPDLTDAWWGW
jgi:biotin-dependent carboxylase-like uncharacterized protein